MSYKLTYKVQRLGNTPSPQLWCQEGKSSNLGSQITLLLISEGSRLNSQPALSPVHTSLQDPVYWFSLQVTADSSYLPGYGQRFAIEHKRSFSCQEACPSSLLPNTNLLWQLGSAPMGDSGLLFLPTLSERQESYQVGWVWEGLCRKQHW